MRADIRRRSLEAYDDRRPGVHRRKLRHLHGVKDAKDVEFPFPGQVRRVGEKREGHMHGEKLHGFPQNAYFSECLLAMPLAPPMSACWLWR